MSRQIAVRAQHICRWKIPRSDFPEGRKGYKEWRTTLYTYHADTTAEILREIGYDDALIEQAHAIVRKDSIKKNPDTQRLEDIACLVFLEFYLEPFAVKYSDYDEDKMLRIIRKTWRKMSEVGHQAALGIKLPEELKALVVKAVS